MFSGYIVVTGDLRAGGGSVTAVLEVLPMCHARLIFALASVASLGLLLTGCDYTRDTSRVQRFDDVGEIDVDARDHGYATYERTSHDTSRQRPPERESAGLRHAHEVGEMSIDDGAPVRTSKPAKRTEAPKVTPPAKPVGQAPVRNVPAPAPAPEYRVPATAYVAAKPAVPVRPVALPERDAKRHHWTNVGEIEVGY